MLLACLDCTSKLVIEMDEFVIVSFDQFRPTDNVGVYMAVDNNCLRYLPRL